MQQELKPIKVRYPEIEKEEDKSFQKELDKITEDSFKNGTTLRTIKNIQETLIKHLRHKYKLKNGELKNVSEELLKLHGMSDSAFDEVANYYDYFNKAINSKSIDDNANKSNISDRGIRTEVCLPKHKIIGYDSLYRVMKELWGQEEAKYLSGEMYDYSLAIADSTNITLPYCYAIDASRLISEGRPYNQAWSSPVEYITTYIGNLNETVHQLSSHLAGAIAVGSFFTDIAHIAIYKERIPLRVLKEDKKTRKWIARNFRGFIHSVNSLSRNAIESPFSNVSVFDREKLKAFISEDNYGWLFPKNAKVLIDNNLGGDNAKYSDDEYNEFILDYIFELQKIYIDVFNAGNTAMGGLQYRFPVTTANFTKKELEDNSFDIDEMSELVQFLKNKDVSRFNLFLSKGTKIASCCRLINNSELLEMGSQVNSFGGSNISMGSHRVVTIDFNRIANEAKTYKEFLNILEDRVSSAAKILKAHRILLKKQIDAGMHPFFNLGWLNLDRMFSTYGVIGTYEANIIAKNKYGVDNFDYRGDMLIKFNEFTAKYSKEQGILHNIEQIPGESMAPKLFKATELLYGNPYNFYPMLANQHVPLWEDATIYERLEIDGKYNQMYSGGGICHIQIDQNITSSQFIKILKYAAKCGCEHLAFNNVTTRCKIENKNFQGNLLECPSCKATGKDIGHFSRIIGYFIEFEYASMARFLEFKNRKFVNLDKVGK